jgi:predicted RNA-binding protein with PUA-like domain
VAYWLVKSEPETFSIDDLKRDKRTTWEGVRNFMARNYLRSMEKGDLVLYYHSNTQEPAVVGIAKVVKTAYPDPTQFDPDSHYYDPTSPPDDPRWSMVDLGFVKKLRRPVTLTELKEHHGGALGDFALTRKGNRLSVLPVTPEQFELITKL